MKPNKKILTVAALLASMSLAAVAQADDAQMVNTSQIIQAQRSTAMQRYAGGRLQAVWNPQIKHNDVDWWLRSFSEWGSYDHGDDGAASSKSRSVAAGMDMNTGKETRTGIYAMYNHTKLNGGGADALQQDWRVGAYMGKQHGAVQQYGYVNYGRLGNHYNYDGMDVKYHGQIVELGGEYKYDLHHNDGKIYHVSPYMNVQASRYMQKSYSYEPLHFAAINNNYLAGETGVELRRELQAGNYAVRLGYKRVLAGEGPKFGYEAPGSYNNSYSNDMDKDYLHLTVGGTLKLKQNLSLSAEGGWFKGQRDRELMADVKLNWAF